MKRMLIVGVLALLLVPAAWPHTSYKGHNCKFFTRDTPSTVLYYRECQTDGYGAGPHFHDYVVEWLSSQGWAWVHYHYGRSAPAHAV